MTKDRSFLPNLWDQDRGTPFATPFRTLQREIDSLFERFGETEEGTLMPQLDITENDAEIAISVEMPGVEEDDIEVTLTDDLLNIRGEKKSEHEEKGDGQVKTERSYGMFQRTLRVPKGIDPDRIRAELSKGVLAVTLEKPAESAQAKRKIEIKAA